MPDFEIYRSQSYTFASGGVVPVQLGFLDPARSKTAPVIEWIAIRVNYSVTQGTLVNTPANIISEIFTKVLITDPAGDRLNLRGTSMYAMNQFEFGINYNDGPDLLVSGTDTGSFWLIAPFTPIRGRRRNDYGLPLFEFLDGGQMVLNFTASATLGGTNQISAIGASTSVEVYVGVREERRRELKSRICWLDYDITQTEYSYPVNGSLRYALAFAGEVAMHASSYGTAWGAQNITSRTMNYSAYPSVMLRKMANLETFAHQVADGRSQNNAADTSNTAGVSQSADWASQERDLVLPIVWPRLDQKIGTMVDTTSLHYKTDLGSITTSNLPKMIICSITDRSPNLSARTLGASSMQSMANALSKAGRIKCANGGSSDSLVSSWKPSVAGRLPVILAK